MSESVNGPAAGRGIAPGAAAKWAIVLVVGALFAVPVLAMAEFTVRDEAGGHSFAHWQALLDPARAGVYAPVWIGVGNSLQLAVIVVAIVLFLLAPTVVLVDLRFPALRRAFEFLCLLPVSIPAIVLVVGLAPIYLVIGQWFGTSIWTLSLAYGVTVLPFAFRPIQAAVDATDAKTLAEVARTLGAGWGTILLRVLAPNLRRGLLAASLISVAVVLGEFTIASLLGRQNLQTALFVVNKQDPYVSIVLTLLALLLVFLLLLVIGRLGAAGGAARPTRSRRGASA